jgi:hypothetical protein
MVDRWQSSKAAGMKMANAKHSKWHAAYLGTAIDKVAH